MKVIRKKEGRTRQTELGNVSIFTNQGHKWIELIVHSISKNKSAVVVHAFNLNIPETEAGEFL